MRERLEPQNGTEVMAIRRDASYRPVKLVRGLAGPIPLNVLNYTSPRVMAEVERILQERSFRSASSREHAPDQLRATYPRDRPMHPGHPRLAQHRVGNPRPLLDRMILDLAGGEPALLALPRLRRGPPRRRPGRPVLRRQRRTSWPTAADDLARRFEGRPGVLGVRKTPDATPPRTTSGRSARPGSRS